jgi:Tc toxin complex TcA C-terminal TcB-binding domain
MHDDDYIVLARGASSSNVEELHRELTDTGFEIAEEEVERAYFGHTTSQAVRLLQTRRGHEPTGVADAVVRELLRLERELLESTPPAVLSGVVVDEVREQPLEGARVLLFAAEAVDGGTLHRAITGPDGGFAIPLDRALGAGSVRLCIHNPEGVERAAFDIESPGATDDVRVRISPAAPSISEAAASLDLRLPAALETRLAESQLTTIGAIREAGGLAGMPGLPVSVDAPSVRMLDALAEISILPIDLEASAGLVRNGVTSLQQVASSSPPEIEAATDGRLDQATATRVLAAARAQTSLLTSALTQFRISQDGDPVRSTQALANMTRANCGCEECQEATGPLAYLADLLAYNIAHIRNNGAKISMQFLEDRFHQPFGRLPASCDSLHRPVRQARIVIEVIRAELGVTDAPATYLTTAYAMLLDQTGTSFDELREARRASPTERLELGRRLGIEVPTNPHQPNDPLDDLLLDEHATTGPKALTEAALERLFGLQSTVGDPLRPDPIPGCLLATLRHDALAKQWDAEDWPANPPADMPPIIDPDLLGPGDFRPTDNPATTNAAYEIWLQRRQWVDTRIALRDQERQLPTGFDGLLGDLPMNGLNRTTTRSELVQLKQKQESGTRIDNDLASLGLDQAGFDHLAHVADLDLHNQPILDSEWADVYSIMTQNEKRGQFSAWRADERTRPAWLPATAVGTFPLILGPGSFRVRPPAAAPWLPTPYRSDWRQRRAWVKKLRNRIDREDAVETAVRHTVDVVEEATLVLLRDTLISGLPQPVGATRQNWFTRHFQIDGGVEACRLTTRPEQAIETLQGVPFGARNGLLEDPNLTLEADAFDEEWMWIGSLASWQAAMLVFLFPQRALRPSLLRSMSPGLARLLRNVRARKTLDRASASSEAALYSRYFADVCSLSPVAARRGGSTTPVAPGPQGQQRFSRRVLALGKASSGTFYFSSWDEIVQRSLFGGPPVRVATTRAGFWTQVEGLPPTGRPFGLLAYQSMTGQPRIGLYVLDPQPQSDVTMFVGFDGEAWAEPVMIRPPALVRLFETIGGLPAAAQTTTATEWTSRADDRLIAADVDGDGLREVVVVAASPAPDGTRQIAGLREQDGELVVSWQGSIPAGFNLPSSGPVALRTSSASASERLLLVNSTPGAPALGLFGLRAGTLGLISTLTTGWTVNPAAIFVGADLDGNGVSELVACVHTPMPAGHWYAPTSTDVVVLTVTDTGFVFRTQQTLAPPLNRPAHVTVGASGVPFDEGFEVAVDRAFSVRGRNAGGTARDEVLLTWEFPEYEQRGQGEPPEHVSHYVAALAQDGAPTSPLSLTTYWNFLQDSVNSPTITWLWDPADQFVAWNDAVVLLGNSGIGVARPDAQRRLTLAMQTTGSVPSAQTGALAATWTPAADDQAIAIDLDGDGVQEIVVARADGSRIAVLGRRSDGLLEVRWNGTRVPVPDSDIKGWELTPSTSFVASDVDGDGLGEIVAWQRSSGGPARVGLFHALPHRPLPPDWPVTEPLGPVGVTQVTIEPKHAGTAGGEAELTARRGRIQAAYAANAGNDAALAYLDEAYYYVYVELALRLAASGDFSPALDHFSAVYDIKRPLQERKIAYKLVAEESQPFRFERVSDWLRDPLDPHAIAATRRNTYTRYTVTTIVRSCLLADADTEYTRGTSPSIARAEQLYLKVLELLDVPELEERSIDCAELLDTLDITVGGPEWVDLVQDFKSMLSGLRDVDELASAIARVNAELTADDGTPVHQRYDNARRIAFEALAGAAAHPSMNEIVAADHEQAGGVALAMLASPSLADTAERIGREVYDNARYAYNGNGVQFINSAHDGRFEWIGHGPFHHYVPAPSFSFCIPQDPDIASLQQHAELALQKIRSCRAINGMRADPDPYELPTANEAATGVGDGLPVIPTYDLQPLPYPSKTLAERAKELAGLARQFEQSMVAAYEAGFLASYSEVLARQDLELAVAGTRLKELQVVAAEDRLPLAEIQRDRAQLARDHYADVMQHGREEHERQLALTVGQASFYGFKGIGEFIMSIEMPSLQDQAFTDLGKAVDKGFEAGRQISDYEKAVREWYFQKSLAEQDMRLGEAQITLARDEVSVSSQDLAISQLRVRQAESTLNFLTTKRFMSADVSEWVGDLNAEVYRSFLQWATSTALLYQRQVAFERQMIVPAFIQPDYWMPPPEAEALARAQGDLKGLTGAERLLRDIYALDQYAFETDQRKQQRRKTISAFELDPFAFERFRETGVLYLSTPSSLFDRGAPGEYVRLVRRVGIAIVPPYVGAQATLATSGTSRVVIGGDSFRAVVVQRGPESMAINQSIASTSELETAAQPQMLSPFENTGVDQTWQLTLPKAANPIDYNTLADVFLTIEYSALHSPDYQAQVIEELGLETTGYRAFSFRNEYQDQWFDLHNPDQAGGMTVSFRVEREQFPPNIDPSTLDIRQLALCYVPAAGDAPASWATNLQTTLRFRSDEPGAALFDGGAIGPVDGLLSTLSGTAQSWNALMRESPIGTWTISLPNGMATRRIFEQEEVRDVVFVITYGGELPPWPE